MDNFYFFVQIKHIKKYIKKQTFQGTIYIHNFMQVLIYNIFTLEIQGYLDCLM